MPSATGLGDNEHTCEPRGQIGALVQVVGHEAGGSDWFSVNQQNKALGRPRWRYRCSNRIMCLFECAAILMPPLVPEPTGNNRHQIRPIRYPDNLFLLHCSVLFGSTCAVLLYTVGQHVVRPTVTRRTRSEGQQRLAYGQTSSGLSVVIISADL